MSTPTVPAAAQTYDEWLRRPNINAVARAMCRFFMRDNPVHQTLRNIAKKTRSIEPRLRGLRAAWPLGGTSVRAGHGGRGHPGDGRGPGGHSPGTRRPGLRPPLRRQQENLKDAGPGVTGGDPVARRVSRRRQAEARRLSDPAQAGVEIEGNSISRIARSYRTEAGLGHDESRPSKRPGRRRADPRPEVAVRLRRDSTPTSVRSSRNCGEAWVRTHRPKGMPALAERVRQVWDC